MPLIVIILRAIGVSLGVLMIGMGVPLFFMPIPLGIVFFALGAIILIVSSTQAADWVRRRRERHPGFDARLRRIEDALPRLLRGILSGTRPKAS